MKSIKFQRLFLSGIMVALLLFASIDSMACEACNRIFLDGLLSESEINSLKSKELRASIAAQSSKGESPVKWVNEVLAMNDLTVADIDPKALSEILSNHPEVVASQGTAKSSGSNDLQGLQFRDIMQRDRNLPLPATSYVPQDTKPDKYVRLTLEENDTYIGNGVIYKGFTVNNRIPGPTVVVQEGDVVSLTIVNKGNITHGASVHAVYSQTSKYLGKIAPGDSATVVFQANTPGVYMYHCAPGGHAIPMHIIFGQYGMMVVEPKKKFELERILNKEPDIEINLVQHEYYASGKDAVDGQGKPMYTAFNGKLFRYIEEPIVGKPGDYVRINFLNVGPNLVSTFHIVGIVWDYAYWQGNPENKFVGGQSVTAGPSDSWTIEFRLPPDEGSYLMLSHAVGSTDRGALGFLVCDAEAKPIDPIMAEGFAYTDQEMEEYRNQASRTITPFGLGSEDVDVPVIYNEDTKEVTIRIIGNSFDPKVVQVAPGTKIKWINEDVFTFMEGEFSGIHNVVVREGPEVFYSDLMAHAESFEKTITTPGEYTYMCTPHPYMEGKVIVKGEPVARQAKVYAAGPPANTSFYQWSILVLAALALVVSIYTLARKTELLTR